MRWMAVCYVNTGCIRGKNQTMGPCELLPLLLYFFTNLNSRYALLMSGRPKVSLYALCLGLTFCLGLSVDLLLYW